MSMISSSHTLKSAMGYSIAQEEQSDEVFTSMHAVVNSKIHPDIITQVEVDIGIDVLFSRGKYILIGSWDKISAAKSLLEELEKKYDHRLDMSTHKFGSMQSLSSSAWRRDIVNGFDKRDGSSGSDNQWRYVNGGKKNENFAKQTSSQRSSSSSTISRPTSESPELTNGMPNAMDITAGPINQNHAMREPDQENANSEHVQHKPDYIPHADKKEDVQLKYNAEFEVIRTKDEKENNSKLTGSLKAGQAPFGMNTSQHYTDSVASPMHEVTSPAVAGFGESVVTNSMPPHVYGVQKYLQQSGYYDQLDDDVGTNDTSIVKVHDPKLEEHKEPSVGTSQTFRDIDENITQEESSTASAEHGVDYSDSTKLDEDNEDIEQNGNITDSTDSIIKVHDPKLEQHKELRGPGTSERFRDIEDKITQEESDTASGASAEHGVDFIDSTKLDEDNEDIEQNDDNITNINNKEESMSDANPRKDLQNLHDDQDENVLESFHPVPEMKSDDDDDDVDDDDVDDDDEDEFDADGTKPFYEEILIDQNLFEFMQQTSVKPLTDIKDKYSISIKAAERGDDFGVAMLSPIKGVKLNLQNLAAARDEFTLMYQTIMLTCAEEICELKATISIECHQGAFEETIMKYPDILIKESPPNSQRHIFVGPHKQVREARHFFMQQINVRQKKSKPGMTPGDFLKLQSTKTNVPLLFGNRHSGKVVESDHQQNSHLQCMESRNLGDHAEVAFSLIGDGSHAATQDQSTGTQRFINEAHILPPEHHETPNEKTTHSKVDTDVFSDMPELESITPDGDLIEPFFQEPTYSKLNTDQYQQNHAMWESPNSRTNGAREKLPMDRDLSTERDTEVNNKSANGEGPHDEATKQTIAPSVVEWLSDGSDEDSEQRNEAEPIINNSSTEEDDGILEATMNQNNDAPSMHIHKHISKTLPEPEIGNDLPTPKTTEGLRKMRESIIGDLCDGSSFSSEVLVDALLQAEEIEKVDTVVNFAKQVIPHKSSQNASEKLLTLDDGHLSMDTAELTKPEFRPKMQEDGSFVDTCDANVCTHCTIPVRVLAALECGHHFCVECIRNPRRLTDDMCPVCGAQFIRERLGQPEGDMSHIMDKKTHLPNFTQHGTLLVKFAFPASTILGNDGEPKPYPSTKFETYLPNNGDGRTLFKLFLRAHKDKTLFEVLSVKGVNAIIQMTHGITLKTDQSYITQDYIMMLTKKLKSFVEQ